MKKNKIWGEQGELILTLRINSLLREKIAGSVYFGSISISGYYLALNFFLIAVSFALSGCAQNQKSTLQYYELPMNVHQSAPTPQHNIPNLKGFLIVEKFKDYRALENPNYVADDCSKADFETVWNPSDKECRNDVVKFVAKVENSNQVESLDVAIPKAISVDFRKRGLFDQAVYAESAEHSSVATDWRMIGLIHKVSNKMIYYGAPVPIVSGYLRPLGIPVVRIETEVELELKLENLKEEKIYLKKRYLKRAVSQDFNEYQVRNGFYGWNISHYELAKTIKLIMEDFVKDFMKAVSEGK